MKERELWVAVTGSMGFPLSSRHCGIKPDVPPPQRQTHTQSSLPSPFAGVRVLRLEPHHEDPYSLRLIPATVGDNTLDTCTNTDPHSSIVCQSMLGTQRRMECAYVLCWAGERERQQDFILIFISFCLQITPGSLLFFLMLY